MGDIYDYIADCEFESRWRAEMPDKHKAYVKELEDKVRCLENRVKYWKRKAKNNETK